MNKLYGFEGEVTSKYSSQMMALFSEVFDWLPLAHCIEGKILVSHTHNGVHYIEQLKYTACFACVCE